MATAASTILRGPASAAAAGAAARIAAATNPTAKPMKTMLGIELKRRIVGTVNALGRGMKIKVFFRGTRAYTNGTMIVLPAIKDLAEIPYDTARALIGYAIHEVGHIRYTDFAEVARAYDGGKLVKKFQNCIEDYRIEREMARAFAGAAADLTALRVRIHPKLKTLTTGWLADPRACGPLALTWTGAELNGFANPHLQKTLDVIQPPVLALIRNWTDRMDGVETTAETTDLAIEYAAEAIRYAERTQAPDRTSQPSKGNVSGSQPPDGSDPEPKPQTPDQGGAADASEDKPEPQPNPEPDAPEEDSDDAPADDAQLPGGDAEGPSSSGQDGEDDGDEGVSEEEIPDHESTSDDGSTDGSEAVDQQADEDADLDAETDQAGDDAASDETDGAAHGERESDDVEDGESGVGNGADADASDGDGDDTSERTDGQHDQDDAGDTGDDHGEAEPKAGRSDDDVADAERDEGEDSSGRQEAEAEDGECGDQRADQNRGSRLDGGEDAEKDVGDDRDRVEQDGQASEADTPEAESEADGSESRDVDHAPDQSGVPQLDDDDDDDSGPREGSADEVRDVHDEQDDQTKPDASRGERDDDREEDPFASVLDPNAAFDDFLDDIAEAIREAGPLPQEEPEASDGEVDPGEVVDDVAKANESAPSYDSDDPDNDDGEEAEQSPQRPGKNDYDDARFHPIDVDKVTDDQFGALRDAASGTISTTARIIKRLLMAEERKGVLQNRRSGEFDIRNMSSIIRGTGACYKKTWERPAPRTLLATLVDFSGSMKGMQCFPFLNAAQNSNAVMPITLAMMGALAIEEATRGTSVDTLLYGYTGYSPTVKLYPFKDRAQAQTQTRRMIGAYRHCDMGCTPTGEAMAALALRMDKAEQTRRIMVVLTDGGADDMDLCAEVSNLLISRGIEVVAIGIQSDTVREWAPVSHVIQDISGLPQALLSTIDPRKAKQQRRAAA